MHEARRARVQQRLGDDAALILPASPELIVGRDAELRYVVDPDLFYLTGYVEPEAVLVLCPSYEEAPFTLFVRPRDPERELWTGVRGGTDAARERFGAAAAHPVGELAQRLPALVGGVSRLYARIPSGRPDVDAAILDVVAKARRTRPRTGRGPHTITDHGVLLDELRLRKDPSEVRALRAAARTSVDSFLASAASIRPGAAEWNVEAALEAEFRARGGSGPAFPTIVAAGANATVLHYIENSCPLEPGRLVLVDAGARRAMYCADISRTFPVGGRFTPEQRRLYDAVLAARNAAIARARPGATVRDVHDAALRVLLEALHELGFLPDTVERALEQEDDYKRFYPHRTSHWLGLDVHDVGDYVVNGESRVLEPDMVLTIEPGLYIPDAVERGAISLAGTGVRIEDDVLVTEEGAEVLTEALPVRAEDVEAMVR